MTKPRIYVVQFGTGASINLLPLAAGQLCSRLLADEVIADRFDLPEIIFRRPRDPGEFASQLQDVSVIGFSCFLWNVTASLQAARVVRERFPDALIVLGGPSIPKDPDFSEPFIRRNPFIDVIGCGEGEEVFATLCRRHLEGRSFDDVPGIILHDRAGGEIRRTGPEKLPVMESLPSPYLDGTFDSIYSKYREEFSGIIWETNRGCPYRCAYCTWGNLPSNRIREKPIEQVRTEVEWIGRNGIRYIGMSDANFGIRQRDVDVANLLAECKRTYGVPNFISVSWVKNSHENVLKIADILTRCGIGYRVTLSLQSLNQDVVKAVNRLNIRKSDYEEIRKVYHRRRLFSYTELILGLPQETKESFLAGVEESLSDSVYDQLYIYPCLLFPNTALASRRYRRQYGIESTMVWNRYTKNKEFERIEEQVEIVVGTKAMPREDWRDTFVLAYCTLAIHDSRLAFFILKHLKRKYRVRATDLIVSMRDQAFQRNHSVLQESFRKLMQTAEKVQSEGASHLIEPDAFGGVPFDPPEGTFLDLMMRKERFYREFFSIVVSYLTDRGVASDTDELRDLFRFQNAVMAHPDGPRSETVRFEYNWVEHFGFAFHLSGSELTRQERIYRVVDPHPCGRDPAKYLAGHFDVRGVPAFNELYDADGKKVFPVMRAPGREAEQETLAETEAVAS
ncbi:MAG TPA: radical SAM protein [Sedimentisphaerales bacterium]|nr:radical SAM protein [Sedimentisphaerales bacterium]